MFLVFISVFFCLRALSLNLCFTLPNFFYILLFSVIYWENKNIIKINLIGCISLSELEYAVTWIVNGWQSKPVYKRFFIFCADGITVYFFTCYCHLEFETTILRVVFDNQHFLHKISFHYPLSTIYLVFKSFVLINDMITDHALKYSWFYESKELDLYATRHRCEIEVGSFWEADSHTDSQEICTLAMEIEGSLSCSQEPSTGSALS